jgi:DNA-binding transcriptional MerR regulator
MNESMGIYNIDSLARRAGLTRRTVRYYVQRGLLEPPQGGGRGSYYTEEHLRRLERIRSWAEQGVPLLHMKALLEKGMEPAGELPEMPTEAPAKRVTAERASVPYERMVLADGVELHVRRGALPPWRLSPERLERVRKLLMDQEER